MAARRDDNVTFVFMQHSFILAFDNGSAESGLFNIVKAEFLYCFTHCLNADSVVIRDKGRSKTDDNGFFALQYNFNYLGLVYYLFCVLGTDYEALTAENTFVADYVRLVSRKSDGFNGTVTDTFVAVFAV